MDITENLNLIFFFTFFTYVRLGKSVPQYSFHSYKGKACKPVSRWALHKTTLIIMKYINMILILQ